MQIPGFMKKTRTTCNVILCCGMSKKIASFLSAASSFLILSSMSEIPRAYAHVSHVLSEDEYTSIKSGYPDVEIIAVCLTGIIAFSAILTQSTQKSRERLEKC